MKRRSFIRALLGAVAATPLVRFLPKKEDPVELTPFQQEAADQARCPRCYGDGFVPIRTSPMEGVAVRPESGYLPDSSMPSIESVPCPVCSERPHVFYARMKISPEVARTMEALKPHQSRGAFDRELTKHLKRIRGGSDRMFSA